MTREQHTAAREGRTESLRKALRKIPKHALVEMFLDTTVCVRVSYVRGYEVVASGCGCCEDSEHYETAEDAVTASRK